MTNHTDLQIDTFLPYMRDVSRCEQSLRELNTMWRMIEASAKMNCPVEAKAILPTMAATRAGFNRLEEELVTSLVSEKVGSVLDEIGTKAQYVIDIVVRNLFERTADVGFLATDKELCTFVAGLHENDDMIRARLRAYRNKYTVYDEIILLDTAGNVLVQIDESTPIEGTTDSLLAETLASDTYVETFRATDLRPGKKEALIYSRRMHHPDTNAVVGVLCLCFNFEHEMAGIFQSHRDPALRSNMLLLDGRNRVIASADPLWIPPGAAVPVNRAASPQLMVYGGREYLVRTFSSAGYQGYPGPTGWQGQVMIPVELGFSGKISNALTKLDERTAEGLLSHAQSFCPPLFEIMQAAETIRRVVWNGQVMTAGQNGELLKLKTILEQISETGARSNELFAQSIRDLYETVLSANLSDAEFVSHLMVDLLDRNLYERSDDCRWWALTPELQSALADPHKSPETLARLNEILGYINSLYTVYTRIFIYDDDGVIIASTDFKEDGLDVVGSMIDEETLMRVRGLSNDQQYTVTPFEPTTLYGNRPTYVYHAAIRHPDNEMRIVGGIGIVFDSEPEFAAMLKGAIGDKSDVSALFVDRTGRIISSTDATRPVGDVLEIDPALLAMKNGESASRIVIHDGHYATLGATVSHGYREFKTSDGYVEDVIAVVYKQFGEERQQSANSKAVNTTLEVDLGAPPGREFATFFVDGSLFALEAEYVSEALPASEVSPMSMGSRPERIGIMALRHEDEGKRFVWVFDLGHLMRGYKSEINSASQVVIVKRGNKSIGLLVSELHGVPEFQASQITPTPLAAPDTGMLVTHVIQANRGELLIQAVNIDHLFAVLNNEEIPIDASMKMAA
ncbi:MAG: chemotaxis protein CheW [Oxalicibacterium faecigallinarum]|uniref:chemotaxis protein CheW n=1 Tax=Oxalicibacterium faecigallinarum TaxID=573741 RepID=UPI0028092F6C|nr:chemotaxis protein CheW [Oxalicibacterium faecigallinarum]MDQ7968719.1 chemotaxis protein CheW [Oxalicibacterium faecigallinarum]